MEVLENFLYSYYIKSITYYKLYFHQQTEINKIINNIYLGYINGALDINQLNNNNIKNIITVLLGGIPIFDNYNYLIINVIDNEYNYKYNNISKFFDQTNQFIENSIKKNENVYIHCIAGISRSATIICAYLIWKYNMTVDESINKIKQSRNIINPNKYFREQLHNYYNELNNTIL